MINLFAIVGLFAVCGISSTNALNLQSESFSYGVNENIEFHQDNKLNVAYDDENYQITLTADELNNYSWYNLADCLNNYEDLTGIVNTHFEYNNDQYDYEELSANDYLEYYNGLYTIDLRLAGNYKFAYYDSENVLIEFESDAVWFVTSTFYNDFKQAVVLDIQANSQVEPINAFPTIISTLVGGISGFASGLGAGVSNLVSNIFVDNGGLSVFGYMVVIFAGISLAIGLSRWIMNFLTSLGAKK